MFTDQKTAIVQEYKTTSSVIAVQMFLIREMQKNIFIGKYLQMPPQIHTNWKCAGLTALYKHTTETMTSLLKADNQLQIPPATIQKILKQPLSQFLLKYMQCRHKRLKTSKNGFILLNMPCFNHKVQQSIIAKLALR